MTVLITGMRFAAGRSNGYALAMIARQRRPDVRIIFTADPEFAEQLEGVGLLLPRLMAIPDLFTAVQKLLDECPSPQTPKT